MLVKMRFEDGNIVNAATLRQIESIVGQRPEHHPHYIDSEGKERVAYYSFDIKEDTVLVDDKFTLKSGDEYVCDMDLMMQELPELKFLFKPIRRATASQQFVHVVDKHREQLNSVTSEQNVTFNDKCEVHMPGFGLMQYNRVALLEDSCTDKLQDALASGWRIIAACPQPNQRRPDYVLGRYEPDYKGTPDEAERL